MNDYAGICEGAKTFNTSPSSKCVDSQPSQNLCTDMPWKPAGREYEFGIIGFVWLLIHALCRLHKEIKDFYNFIVPNVEEQLARELVVLRVKNVVLGHWPDCQVILFFSLL